MQVVLAERPVAEPAIGPSAQRAALDALAAEALAAEAPLALDVEWCAERWSAELVLLTLLRNRQSEWSGQMDAGHPKVFQFPRQDPTYPGTLLLQALQRAPPSAGRSTSARTRSKTRSDSASGPTRRAC